MAYEEGEPETYVLPLTMAVGSRAEEVQQASPQAVLARVRQPDAEGLLCEAWWEPPLWEAVLAAIARGERFQGTAGALCAFPTQAFADLRGPAETALGPTPLAAEQSNTSVVYGDRLILKLFRRVADGVNPDLELGRFLTERTSFSHIARVAGALEYRSDTGASRTVGILHGFVPHREDAWAYTLEALDRYFAAVRARQNGEQAAVPHQPLLTLAEGDVPPLAGELIGPYLASAQLLGQRTAELHCALASDPEDPRFAPEPVTQTDQHALAQSIRGPGHRGLPSLSPAPPCPASSRARGGPAGPGPGGGDAGSGAGGVSAAAHRAADPHPWRLPPGAGAHDRRRLHHY